MGSKENEPQTPYSGLKAWVGIHRVPGYPIDCMKPWPGNIRNMWGYWELDNNGQLVLKCPECHSIFETQDLQE